VYGSLGSDEAELDVIGDFVDIATEFSAEFVGFSVILNHETHTFCAVGAQNCVNAARAGVDVESGILLAEKPFFDHADIGSPDGGAVFKFGVAMDHTHCSGLLFYDENFLVRFEKLQEVGHELVAVIETILFHKDELPIL